MIEDVLLWISARRYELILPLWFVLVMVWLVARRVSPSKAAGYFPGIVALALAPPMITVFLWPASRWPTYRDQFFESAYHEAIAPIDAGFSALLYHPGYVVLSLIGIYAVNAAISGGRLPLSRVWGYATVFALYAIEELVFFRLTVVE
jgi:hypothetical protein